MSTVQHPPSSHHSLAFRVMRLCRPSLQVEDAVLRLDPFDLFAGEDLFDDPAVSPSLLDRTISRDSAAGATPLGGGIGGVVGGDFSYRSRFQLQSPTDAMALSGILMLPQAFGAIYLGEKFSSYISVNNSSDFEARDVVIKAEIQTERQRILLLDTSKSPVESIRSGGRYDFIVEHDVKELGPHTLVCSALYNDGDSERKYLPQFFKFVVANPLSVRTKVRLVKDKTFLEACIENHTKSNLYMDQVEFEPAQHWSATVVKVDGHPSELKSLTREIFRPPALIRGGGGIHNYLYQLRQTSNELGQFKVEGSNILGKLQITWRTNLGEPGRLQTQNILGSPITRKEVEIQIVEIPSVIILERPFLMHLKLRNHRDRKMGPFEVSVSPGDTAEERVVMINGLQKLVISHVDALSSTEFSLNMIATKLGVQKISGITVSHAQEDKVYDSLPEAEIFVDSD